MTFRRMLVWIAANALGVSALAAVDSSLDEKAHYLPSPRHFGVDLQYSSASYTSWQLAPGQGVGGPNPGIHVGVEWLTPFPWGKLGLGVGATGGIHLNAAVGKNADGSTQYASFSALPLELSLSYRFDYTHYQILVPFVRGGLNTTFAGQTSKTGGPTTSTLIGHGWDVAGGVEIPLHFFDRRTQQDMDRMLGVNGTYLIGEYIVSRTLLGTSAPNLSRNEWRMGIRFEL